MKELPSVSIFVLLLILGSTFFGCDSSDKEPVEFSMQVIPESIEDSIPGQRCVFLVAVEDERDGEGGEVNISATVEGATVTVNPMVIIPGQVAEATVIPDELIMGGMAPIPIDDGREPIEPEPDMGETLTVTITGEREGLEQTETVTIAVSEATIKPEEMLPTAVGRRDKFIPWLAANHPELAITNETEWISSIVRPHIMVVMYYLFFSEEWEMGVRWHVTIPPHDWAEIYLRQRTTETVPSHAFKIPSLDAGDDPQIVTPPESVWR